MTALPVQVMNALIIRVNHLEKISLRSRKALLLKQRTDGPGRTESKSRCGCGTVSASCEEEIALEYKCRSQVGV